MIRYISLLLFIGLAFWACEDEPEDCAGVAGGDNICGCTDSTATNYDSTATFDDESCEYDTTPPTVTITSPQNGTTVYEIATITCMSSDNEGVEKVELWVNGVSTGVTDNSEPYSFDWNTTTLEDGNYTIIIRSYDISENTTDSEPITLTVDNSLSNPISVELYPINYENNSFVITWSQNIDADFQSYSLYESFSEDMSGATLIYETDLLADTTYTVTGISSGETRYYQVVTKDVFGLESESAIGVALYTRLWSDIYDWNGVSDWGNSVIEVSDGYWTLGVGDERMRLFKTDLAGNLNTSTEFGFGYGNQILEADDGSLLLIGGGYDSDIDEYAMLVIKTDAVGTELWRQYLGANSWGYGGLLNDNGEIIIYGEEDGNTVVYALSQDGTNFNVVVAFDNNMDRAKGMVKVDGGGYYIAFSKDYETIILGTDENFVWETEVDIAGYCRSLSLASDGTLLATLQTSDSEHTYMKFYPQTGQTIWSGTAAGLYSGFQAGDSYYFVGHDDDGMSLFLRLNENGDIITSSSFGSGILSGYTVTSDGGLIFTGTTSYWNDEQSDTPLYKTNLNGELGNTFNLAHGLGHVFSIGINKDFNMAPVQMNQKQSD
jgi:hypothetical protein